MEREQKVLVSVIIPIYNVEKYIEKCVASVVEQTWKDIEIICVNDGTPDGSMEIVKRQAESDCRIKIVDIENSGLSMARNVGMQHATGKYICFLDSDDYLALDAVEKLVDSAEQNKADLVFFSAETIFEDDDVAKSQKGYTTYYKRNANYPEVYRGQDLFVQMMNNRDFKPSACMVFINREFINRVGVKFYPGILHEDNLFTITLLSSAEHATVLNEDFYKRLVRAGSIVSVGKSVKHAYGFFVCHKEILNYIGKEGLSIEFFAALMKHLNVMKKNAVKNIENMTLDSIMEEIDKIDAKETGNFLAYIYEEYNNQKQVNAVTKAKKVVGNVVNTGVGTNVKAQSSGGILKRVVGVGKKLLQKRHKVKNKIKQMIPRKIRWFFATLKNFGWDYFAYRKNLKKNKDKICVSVIMPVYNVEKYLPAALDSLLAQNLRNIEIICVENGSTDASWSILEDYSKKDNRIKIYQREEKGAGAARNFGLKQAQGEYLLFLDADDIFNENLCNEVYYRCIKTNADACLFGAQRIDMQTMKKEPMGWVLKTSDIPSKDVFSGLEVADRMFQMVSGCPWSKMFRREYILEKGLEYQNLPNANDAFFIRVNLALADRIAVVNKEFVTYRYNEGTNIQSNKSKAPTAFYEAFKAIKNELKARGVYEQYEQSFCNMVLTESLFNLRTAGTEEAQKKVYDLLKNEAIEFFEFFKHDENYYSRKNDYLEMKKIYDE